MSTSTEISRLQTARNTIRNKMVNLGLGTSTDLLDDLATEIDGITNRGAVSATVQEGDTYTIPAGYHNGSGTVSGVSGGGNYTLQAKSVTPTKSQQSVTADNGYYGLSGVTVGAIPEAYQDVSSVTAAAGDVLANKTFVLSDGTVTAGTMTNNGAVSKTLDTTTGNQSYTIPTGYHNGSGKVSITTEEKSATPSGSSQTIKPTSGKVLSKVTVAAIPAKYGDTTGDDAVAANLLYGKVAHSINNGSAVQITGSMTNNGAVSKTLDATTSNQSYTVPAGYHNGSGTVSITLEEKSATPSETAQTITPTSGKVLSQVSVGAIASDYVGSGITRRTVSDLTVDGPLVNVPAGYYASAAGKAIANGTAGNPVGTKTVENGVALIQISVTNTTGYITGSTRTGENVYVTAEELVSGNKAITENGTNIDVADYATVSVAVPEPQPTFTITKNAAGTGIQSITCDRSYLNCESYINGGGPLYAAVAIPVQSAAGYMKVGAWYYKQENNTIYYYAQLGLNESVTGGLDVPDLLIAYPSSGSITWQMNPIDIITSSSSMTQSGLTVTAPAGYYPSALSKSLPSTYADLTGDDAVAANILSGKKAHSLSSGSPVALTGTMTNRGAVTATIDGLTTTSYTIAAGYHNGSGTVSLTNDIETALAAI